MMQKKELDTLHTALGRHAESSGTNLSAMRDSDARFSSTKEECLMVIREQKEKSEIEVMKLRE
jgi:hypothetical protein